MNVVAGSRFYRRAGGWRRSAYALLVGACLLAGAVVPSSAFAAATLGPGPAVGSRGLPDGRGYELISPVEKSAGNGGVLPLTNTYQEYGSLQTTPDGGAVTYLGEAFYEPTVGGVNQYLTAQGTAGWTTKSISPPITSPTTEILSDHFVGFSRDLSTAVRAANQPIGPGSPPGYQDLWVTDTDGSSFEPLVTATPPNRGTFEFQIEFVGGSADFSRIFFQANDALAPGAEDHGEEGCSAGGCNLYEWHAGQLRTVNLLGGESPKAFFGSRAEEEHGAFNGAISDNGERQIWTDLATSPTRLYVSEDGAAPRQIDLSEGPGENGGGRFLEADADGSRIFFTDGSQLTADSTAAEEEPDLYEYDVDTGKLSDLSVSEEAGGHGDALGLAGISEDGSYVYLVARGVLAPGAVAGEPNLYVEHGGAVELVATLLPRDADLHVIYQERNGQIGDWSPIGGIRTTDVTPDGHYIAFQSAADLTGYESHETYEVFLYDAASNELRCASCDPTGAAPSGSSVLPITNFGTNPPRWLSDTAGPRLFFDSSDPLVPWDTGPGTDVYEYENGSLSLISSGSGAYDSNLATASEGGEQLFFTTSDRLVGQDPDELIDLYDAGIGAGVATEPPVVPCSAAEQCRPGARGSAEVFEPASSFLQGTATPTRKTGGKSNSVHLRKALATCKKKHPPGQGRRRCEGSARRRFATKPKQTTEKMGSAR